MGVRCGGVLGQGHRQVLHDMGEGHCIRFQYDPWSGHTPLKDLFPNLFVCSLSKEAQISNLVVFALGGVRIYNCTEIFMIENWRVYVLFLSFFIPYAKGQGG